MILKRLLDSTFVHMLFAFLAMGSWAYFANRLHPFEEAIRSACLQGLISASITFFMKKGLEALSSFFRLRKMRWTSLFAPPLIACSISLMVLIGGHMAIKTPELLATISIPFSVAFSYACIYNFRLWVKNK